MNHPNHLIHPHAHGISSELQAAVHTNTNIPYNTRRAVYREFLIFVIVYSDTNLLLQTYQLKRCTGSCFICRFAKKDHPEESWVVVVSEDLIETCMPWLAKLERLFRSIVSILD
jgi:hypothetical protein